MHDDTTATATLRSQRVC